MASPIKRHDALQPISREHHFGLLLCWKIQKAASKNLSAERVFKYVRFAFETELLPHFHLEEKVVFTVLGNDHPMVKQALEEHQRLEYLITQAEVSNQTLEEIRVLLNDHIRFEERILFQKIQEVATEEAYEKMIVAHDNHDKAKPGGSWEDEFWK